MQNAGEKVSEYLAELRKIADNCGFGSALERNLRDRFVIGLREKMVQRVLLAKPKSLTLQEALDVATSAELAILNADRLPSANASVPGPAEVNAMHVKKGRSGQPSEVRKPRPCMYSLRFLLTRTSKLSTQKLDMFQVPKTRTLGSELFGRQGTGKT